MEAVGPEIFPDRGQVRSKFFLGSNFWGSCPEKMVQRMADCIRTAFNLDATDVVIGKPFSGGHITRTYGNKPVPCIQIEMSRTLYLNQPCFNANTLTVNPSRLAQLQLNFKDTLKMFFQGGVVTKT